jgi:hypothetical protein
MFALTGAWLSAAGYNGIFNVVIESGDDGCGSERWRGHWMMAILVTGLSIGPRLMIRKYPCLCLLQKRSRETWCRRSREDG